MGDNLNTIANVAVSNPVTIEPSPWVCTSTLTLGLTSTQPLMVSIPVNHNDKSKKFNDLNFKI